MFYHIPKHQEQSWKCDMSQSQRIFDELWVFENVVKQRLCVWYYLLDWCKNWQGNREVKLKSMLIKICQSRCHLFKINEFEMSMLLFPYFSTERWTSSGLLFSYIQCNVLLAYSSVSEGMHVHVPISSSSCTWHIKPLI